MQKNRLKEKLRAGKGCIGMFCNLPSPAMVEICGLLGLDFAIIDAEHCPSDLETVENCVRAAESAGISTVARIAMNIPQNILRYLDTGSQGVQIPMINTEDQARAVVDSVKYPPVGKRGLSAVRASGYGIERPLAEYTRMANEETLVVVQLETTESIKNAEKICQVDGVDVVFVGPTDLSSSMGYSGQPAHPDVVRAITNLGKTITKAGKIGGTIARDAEAYKLWRDAGFQFLATSASALYTDAVRAYAQGCRAREAGRP